MGGATMSPGDPGLGVGGADTVGGVDTHLCRPTMPQSSPQPLTLCPTLPDGHLSFSHEQETRLRCRGAPVRAQLGRRALPWGLRARFLGEGGAAPAHLCPRRCSWTPTSWRWAPSWTCSAGPPPRACCPESTTRTTGPSPSSPAQVRPPGAAAGWGAPVTPPAIAPPPCPPSRPPSLGGFWLLTGVETAPDSVFPRRQPHQSHCRGPRVHPRFEDSLAGLGLSVHTPTAEMSQ